MKMPNEISSYYDRVAPERKTWLKKAAYYHADLAWLHQFFIPPGKKVIEIGCGLGDLLAAVKPANGLGIDISPKMIREARDRHPDIHFSVADIMNFRADDAFDYVIISNLIGLLPDVQDAFENLHQLVTPQSRIIITYYSRLWHPILRFAERLHLKMPQPEQNWLSLADVENLLALSGFETVRSGIRMLCPVRIPLVSGFLNRIIAHLPGFRHLCLTSYLVARPQPRGRKDCSVSVIIPTKNEAGNVCGAIERTPQLGTATEYIFIDGHSTDGTVECIKSLQASHADHDIKLMVQSGTGKANAVFEAMDAATGDLLVILDSDLTVPPEELTKFYEAYATGRGEFINGSRLVYPMEYGAMRFLNMIANHLFALIFSWLLGYPIKDTLCGTKVLSRTAYHDLRRGMGYFGNADPFGDFQFIFGASKLGLRVAEIPVHYKARTYGDIEIRRFRDGLLLVRMVFLALRKIKFI